MDPTHSHLWIRYRVWKPTNINWILNVEIENSIEFDTIVKWLLNGIVELCFGSTVHVI